MPTSRSHSEFKGKPFCFIHIPKTAGVTLTHLLEPHCKPYSLDEGLRHNIITESSCLLNRYQGILFWHITYHDLEKWYGKRTMNTFHSFGFIRNPWDWLVSMYHYIKDPKNKHVEQMIVSYMTFSEFLCYWKAKKVQQMDFFGVNKTLGVRKLYRFEKLEESLKELADDIGIERPETLPRMNTSEREDYHLYYTPQTARMVLDICPDDIAIGEYEF